MRAVKVAYLVSRFPHVSETFIVREMERVAGSGVDVELLSLFPAAAHSGPVHPVAEPWVARLRRPGLAASAGAAAAWTARRPLAMAQIVGAVLAGYRRSPRLLARALVTVPIAAAHASTVRSLGVGRIHAHYATYPALAAWIVRRLTGCEYSFTAHAHDLYVDRSMLVEKVRDAAEVVTISDFNRRLIAAETGREARVVHCGVDAPAIAFRERPLPAAGPVRAVCVASLQEYKGHRYLLEALAGLPRIELSLAGDGPLRDELEARAAQLGVTPRVRFLGALREAEIAALLDTADLFVLPSVRAADGQMEGIPVALMEAMAHGLPVVSTWLSGIPELVRDGETGLLAEPADPASLRAALARVLDDPAGAAERARAARTLVEGEFSLAAQAGAMSALLRG